MAYISVITPSLLRQRQDSILVLLWESHVTLPKQIKECYKGPVYPYNRLTEIQVAETEMIKAISAGVFIAPLN